MERPLRRQTNRAALRRTDHRRGDACRALAARGRVFLAMASSVSVSIAPARARGMGFETRLVMALFLGTGLAAYAVGPVPVPWMANAGFIAAALGVLNTRASLPLL